MDEKRVIDDVVEALRAHGIVLGRKTAEMQRLSPRKIKPEEERPEGRDEDDGYCSSYLLRHQALHGERFSAVIVDTYSDP